MTAEEDVKQSRRNLRRRAQKICPATGPTKEEECELKELNKNSIREMYELEDFKRDFKTKPFVATEMVDMSLERIEDNIRKRQLALQTLRREIYEASVLRVTGYYMKDKVSKKTSTQNLVKSSKHASKIALQKYKHAFENALENSKNALETAMGKSKHTSKTAREKVKNSSEHTSRVYSERHAEEDGSYAKVKEIYRAERQRFKNNLEMFNGRLQEFLDSHQNIQTVERVSGNTMRKRYSGVKKVKLDIKTVKPDIKTAKPDVKRVRCNLNTVESDYKTAKSVVETDKPIEKTVKKKRPKESRQERRRREFSEKSGLVSQHDSQVEGKPPTGKKERRRKRKSRSTKEENQTSCDHERPMSLGGSDVEVTKEPVILPLPTLDPMPVYYDNFQASCALTHLFSSRDDFDEDFESDYVILLTKVSERFTPESSGKSTAV
ncbi:glutamic acid-rich protein-like isoform X2 [Mizuhopecten yessoensis]|nr:glutamic acid-rich protein-like isoform X2 [Mizuhopecten yessoensis]